MYDRFQLEQPPEPSPSTKAVSDLPSQMARISNERYLYWDKAKFYLTGKPSEKSFVWSLIREARGMASIPTPIKTPDGKNFTWFRPAYIDNFLNQIDRYNFAKSSEAPSATDSARYLARGIVEESIASSQLEGADTESNYARKMLTENIRPRTKGERMIVNNYRVMRAIENDYKNSPLSLHLLHLLQADLTANTLDDGLRPGELRQDSDAIVVVYGDHITHVPPKHAFVESELTRLVDFANDDSDRLHPVVKAIMLHFWIGYLHPFPDGNGRLARAIFYWYLLRHGYQAVAYAPISMVLKRSQHDYAFSYIYSEQDGLDFTYFYDYNVRCIMKAIEIFEAHQRNSQYDRLTFSLTDAYPNLNRRQILALKYLLSHPGATTSKNSYSIMNGVTARTAYRDLKKLHALGLVFGTLDGKIMTYRPTPELLEILD